MPADSGYGVPGTGAPKWEYRVERWPAPCEVQLCELGAAGWELVTVTGLGLPPHGWFYFKRKTTA